MAKTTVHVNLRLPPELHRMLVEHAAMGVTPNSLNREIVRRLADSFPSNMGHEEMAKLMIHRGTDRLIVEVPTKAVAADLLKAVKAAGRRGKK